MDQLSLIISCCLLIYVKVVNQGTTHYWIKKGKYVHPYQNGDKRVTTIHKQLGINYLNSHLSLHKNQNCIGYNIKYFLCLLPTFIQLQENPNSFITNKIGHLLKITKHRSCTKHNAIVKVTT